MAEIRGRPIYGADVLRCTGPESVTVAHSCCLSKFMALAVAWVLVGASCLHASRQNRVNTRSRPLISITSAGSSNGRLVSPQARATPSRLCARPGSFWPDSRFNPCRGTLDGKPVVIRRIARPQDARIAESCFVSSTEENHLKEILGGD